MFVKVVGWGLPSDRGGGASLCDRLMRSAEKGDFLEWKGENRTEYHGGYCHLKKTSFY